MTTKQTQRTKMVHEGDFVAEVDVSLIEGEEGWAPYLSVDDALKLDDVREALRSGDLKNAKKLSRIYRLMPVDD